MKKYGLVMAFYPNSIYGKELRVPGLHDFLLGVHCVSVMLGNMVVEDTLLVAVQVLCLECPVLSPCTQLAPTPTCSIAPERSFS